MHVPQSGVIYAILLYSCPPLVGVGGRVFYNRVWNVGGEGVSHLF